MMRTTRLTPRRLGMQSFRNAWQRLSVTLLVMVLTMAAQKAWADGGLTDYTFSTGVNQSKWITLSNSATQLIASGQGDTSSSLTDIGFNFTFGDGTYSKFWVNSNGTLSFNSEPSTSWKFQFASSSDQYKADQPKICGMSADMSTGSNGYVKYELTGTAPNRILVCEFFLYGKVYTTSAANVKWQVQLHEASAKVVMVYGDALNTDIYSYQIGLSQSESDIWTIDPYLNHTATHTTGPVEYGRNVWPGSYRYYEFSTPLQPFTDNGDNTYTIHNAEGWDAFCDMLDNFDHNTSGGYCFDGKTVKLDADISITRAAGNTGYHDFTGTFDGQGHTLSVNITDTQNQGTAPFRVISNGATIRNLHVTGSVTGTAHASGLVGKACAGNMLIENCLVETNVNSTVGSNRHCAGIVGHGFGNNQNPNNVNLTLRNCVYAGTITCDNNYIGGLQGWSDGNTLTLENCLFAGNYQGTATGTAAFHPIALHNTGKTTNLTATNVFTAVAPTATNANFIAADGTKTTGRATAPAGLGTQGATYSFMDMTVYENGLYYNGLYYVAPTLSTDNSGAYLINNENDWDYFCDALYNNGTWNRFSGQTVKLGNDISVSRMAGYDYHDFLGTFDGNHKRLTFTATATASYLAPFRNVLGNSDTDRAVIRDLNVVTNITSADQRHTAGLIAEVWGYVDVVNCNVTANITATKGTQTELYPAGLVSQVVSGAQLTVSGCTVGGTISTDGKYAGGIIGIVQGSATITDCVSSVTINSSTEGDGTHGGLVAVQGNYDGSTISITGCVFNGQLLGASTHSCGGFVGWRSQTVNITNSLFVPVQVTINTVDGNTPCATFVRNGDSNTTITNCYYTDALGTAQGTQVYSISKGEYVTTLEINGDATQSYDVSGLSFYSTGFKCGDVLYAAANNQVSLTLAHEDREGYDFIGYTPTAGTLNGSTLTMPNENVTINADYTYSAPSELATTDITTTTATLSWSGFQDSYNVRYRTAGANEWQSIGNIAAKTTTLTGLSNNTTYEWQVQGITGSGVTDWSGTATFTTPLRDPVSYIDENGEQQPCTDYTVLTGSETTIGANNTTTWYVAEGTLSYNQWLGFRGDVHLILKDNAMMSIVTTSNYLGLYDYTNSSISIYAQSTGEAKGQLILKANGYGLYANKDITINGGKVTATGNSDGIRSENGSITINGGEVTATGNYGGIKAKGDITINWTSPADVVYAERYTTENGTVSIAAGKTFTDENGNPYSGTIAYSSGYPIDGKTLTPASIVILPEHVTATGIVSQSGTTAYAKPGATVILAAATGYTLSDVTYTPEGGEATNATDHGDGTYSFTVPAVTVTVSASATLTPTTTLFAANATNDWTTWCSPKEWTVDDSQATVYTVSSVADGTVTLAPLSDATLIPAYMPLLIQRKPQVTDEVVATFAHDGDPSNLDAAPYSYTSVDYFESIGTVMAQVSDARFYGNTGTEGLTIADLPGFNADTYTLFVLYNGAFLRVGSTTGGFPANRCLLAVKNSALSGTAASRLAISISEPTSISEAEANSSLFTLHSSLSEWFTLDGRKLDGKPSHPGVYIYNGKKQVIKK